MMRELLKMAFRNLTRQRRRTLLTGAGMAVAALILVLNQAHSNGLEYQLFTSLIATDFGHIRVTIRDPVAKSSFEEALVRNNSIMVNSDAIAYQLLKDRDVKQINAQITNNVMISHGIKCKPGIMIGIEPDKETDLLTRVIPPASGEPLSPKDKLGVYISDSIAERFSVGINDMLSVMNQTMSGANTLEFRVTGIFKAYSPRMTDNIFVRLDDAQKLLGIPTGATQLKVMLANRDMAKNKAKMWQESIGLKNQLDFTDWEKAGSFYSGTVIAFHFFGLFLSIMLFIVTGFGMMNTMLMAIFSRTREIGTMMALGAKGRQIMGLFLTEAVLLGSAAAGVGVLAGGILITWLHVVGIPAMNESIRFAYESNRIYPYLTFTDMLASFGFVLGLAVITSLYPIYSTTRLKPVEALVAPG